MIKQISLENINEYVGIIKNSFTTVAEDFGFTKENAPHFTAFATTRERLTWQFVNEHRPMYAFYDNNRIIGYYSLLIKENNECELNNLCVIPEYRPQKSVPCF